MLGRLAKRLSSGAPPSPPVKKQDMAAKPTDPDVASSQKDKQAETAAADEAHAAKAEQSGPGQEQAKAAEPAVDGDAKGKQVEVAPPGEHSASSSLSTNAVKDKDKDPSSGSASVVLPSSAAATVGHAASSYFPAEAEAVAHEQAKEPVSAPQQSSPKTDTKPKSSSPKPSPKLGSPKISSPKTDSKTPKSSPKTDKSPKSSSKPGSPSTGKPTSPPRASTSNKRPSPTLIASPSNPGQAQRPAPPTLFARLLSFGSSATTSVAPSGAQTTTVSVEYAVQTFTSRSERQAYEAALDLRTYVVGPSSSPAASALSKNQVKKLKDSLQKPEQANKIIQHLKTLPSHPDHAAMRAEEGKAAGPAAPIHAACLSVTDEEAGKEHFAKLYATAASAVASPAVTTGSPAVATGSPAPAAPASTTISPQPAGSPAPAATTSPQPAGSPAPAATTGAQASPQPAAAEPAPAAPPVIATATASLPSFSPASLTSALGSLNLVSLISAPDLGLGASVDKAGLLAGAVPSAAEIAHGMMGAAPSAAEIEQGVDEVSRSLLALGFKGSGMIWEDHTGVYPPEDRVSVYTYWWGYEVVLPHPSVLYLSKCESITATLLNILTALSIFAQGVREILPFVRYIAQFVDMYFDDIKAQDKGRGVVLAATWLMPIALIPRSWDFPPRPADHPKPAPVHVPILPHLGLGGSAAAPTSAPAAPSTSTQPAPTTTAPAPVSKAAGPTTAAPAPAPTTSTPAPAPAPAASGTRIPNPFAALGFLSVMPSNNAPAAEPTTADNTATTTAVAPPAPDTAPPAVVASAVAEPAVTAAVAAPAVVPAVAAPSATDTQPVVA